MAKSKRNNYHGRRSRDETRVNERIRASSVRVVLADGRQLGVMSVSEALNKAKMVGLDLVEIAANVNPPVCRIIDYGKYKYEQAKLKRSQKKTQTATRMKEVKIRVRTEQHDYNIKMGRLENFLDDGHKVRVVLQYRGRENAHRELGFEKMEKVIVDMKTMARVEQPPRLSGRVLGMTLAPLPKDQRRRQFKRVEPEDMEDEEDFEDDEEFEDGEESLDAEEQSQGTDDEE